MVESNATEWPEIDMYVSGPTELVEFPLSADGAGQSVGAVANIGGFFETLFPSKGGNAFGERGKEKVGFNGKTANRSFDNEFVVGGLDSASTRTHRHAKLGSGARCVTKRALADPSCTAAKRNRGVNGIDNALGR